MARPVSGFPQRRAKQGQVHFDEVVPDTSCHAGLFYKCSSRENPHLFLLELRLRGNCKRGGATAL